MLCRTLVVAVLAASVCAFPRSGSITSSDVINQIISEGYPAELHQVTTADGYILGVHRIPYGKDGPSEGRRPVVFVMHGLMGASSNFIFLGKENGIAYNLADAGYDVWMGNARGNVFSRQHITLDPDHSQQKYDFFDFSWEEIATIDVPTMVDYALSVSGQQTLHYVGHSQGGTSFLVLNSMKPEYNEKFVSAHLLAGVGYMNNFPNSELRAAALMTTVLYSLARGIGLVEIRTLDDISIAGGILGRSGAGYSRIDYCMGDIAYKEYCNMLGLNRIMGDTDMDGLGVGGASLKQFAHYGQNIRDKVFRRWDFGILSNNRVYGSRNPPAYDLSRINVPITMHYTVSDELLNEQDVLAMARDLPKAEARKIARKTFSHVDFIQAADVRELVTNYMIYRLNRVERTLAGIE
ncbi:lipase 3-like [Leguminivora glycinivorella]|uniref:lipase 3-like n=1 Tax=Leguminivora glycinivorella TaxID=1035111 RepID=UPI00200BA2F3|nr:lipase 3-like [Leguminivora glycinivorella]